MSVRPISRLSDLSRRARCLPDYDRLPRDPRDWRPEMFTDGHAFFCALTAAMRHGRIPDTRAQGSEVTR